MYCIVQSIVLLLYVMYGVVSLQQLQTSSSSNIKKEGNKICIAITRPLLLEIQSGGSGVGVGWKRNENVEGKMSARKSNYTAIFAVGGTVAGFVGSRC